MTLRMAIFALVAVGLMVFSGLAMATPPVPPPPIESCITATTVDCDSESPGDDTERNPWVSLGPKVPDYESGSRAFLPLSPAPLGIAIPKDDSHTNDPSVFHQEGDKIRGQFQLHQWPRNRHRPLLEGLMYPPEHQPDLDLYPPR